MFEDHTYESILNDMLSRVTNDVDKREGSIIYDALAPCAYYLAEQYFNLDNFLNLVSGDTAVGEYLDRVVADYGLTRKEAASAVRKIETTGVIDIGTRWSLNDTTYEVIELISEGTYSAICEQEGEIGNTYSGKLENIDNVNGVTAFLTDIITSGADEETDDNLRERFYSKVQAPATSGNVYHYKKWALEVSGVGDAKVFPLWNGNGTVKILVINNEMEIEPTLPATVYNYIETVRPIGATVTVASPISQTIDISANVTLDGTKLLEDVQTTFISTIGDYLKDTIFDTYSISYAKIGSLLLSTEGVKDHDTLLVNGGAVSITLTDEQIPVIGTITLTEV
ncbi:baseplate J/gp47 family protein [Anaerovorax odorimutans]|uniref:baseplate J/gp47 family protein n=1 Tax=Anaerovorax odorimutans TaxID=109327 RepID=UPI00041B3940|nr:baseplate J/gp47 family protein [Anaerovorax odorimutans]